MTSPSFVSYMEKYILLCAFLCISQECIIFSFNKNGGICKLYDTTISETEELYFQEDTNIYLINCGAFESPEHLTVTGQRQLGLQAPFSCDPGYYSVGAYHVQCTSLGQWSQKTCSLVRTCYEAYELGITIPQTLTVKPQTEMDAVDVECVIGDNNGVSTLVGHDDENTEMAIYTSTTNIVHHIPLTYNIPLPILVNIIDLSDTCSQYMRFQCKHSSINDNGSYFLTRLGEQADYFGGGVKGSVPGERPCGCHVTNSCDGDGTLCNCDVNDVEWREDVGYIRYKEDLPVTEFVGTDTEDDREEAIVTIGNVQCMGKVSK